MYFVLVERSVVYVYMCACNDAILLVAMVFMISLVISNKLLAVAFQWFFLSFEPSDITSYYIL